MLVDEAGQIIYPPDRARAADGSGWAAAIAAATRGASGTLTAEANGQKALFAFSPVHAATPYAVVFARPWRTLTANVEQQGLALGGILLFGLILASIAGVLLAGYLARPLQALASGAIRIARGEPVPAAERPGAGGRDRGDRRARGARSRTWRGRSGSAIRSCATARRCWSSACAIGPGELLATQAALVDAERFAAMGKTSAAIAHELKNSLNGLGMAVELIAQDPANEARVARLRPQVASEIARLRDVVDSLLSFSRSPRIDRAPADLSGVVSRAVGLLSELATEREVDVKVRAPSALRTRCDAHKVQGVVVNLVKNAIEAGRRVEIAAQRLEQRSDHRSRRRRPRPVAGSARPPVRAVLHHQAERHRAGAADVAALHRGARRQHRGRDVARAGRRAVPAAASAGGGDDRRPGREQAGGAPRMKPSVLVIDDEKTFRIVAEEALAGEGFVVTTQATGKAGLAAWQREPCDLVILDRHLPDTDGIAVLEVMAREARERGLDTLIVIATAYADVASAVQALKLGAFDYLSKPLQLPDLVVTMRKALEAKRLRAQVRQLTGRTQAAMGDFVAGPSAAMQKVIGMVDKVAEATDTTVLIQGESGTGKELIADLIARRTPRRCDGPFVEINCATVPETLIESELFGHERGAFTDAKAQKRGLFEEADGGTLFLDEVGEMPMATQAKLLRVLEEMTFRRLGGTRDLSVDVRIVAATNKELGDEVERGRFRLDLYHRLDVFHIRVPPLRDRREDILPLAAHFLARFATRMRKPVVRFSPETERLLAAYDYPGNVRELRNVIERAVILSSGEVIDPGCIVLSGSDARAAGRAGTSSPPSWTPAAGRRTSRRSSAPTSRACSSSRAATARRSRACWASRTRPSRRRSPTTVSAELVRKSAHLETFS